MAMVAGGVMVAAARVGGRRGQGRWRRRLRRGVVEAMLRHHHCRGAAPDWAIIAISVNLGRADVWAGIAYAVAYNEAVHETHVTPNDNVRERREHRRAELP